MSTDDSDRAIRNRWDADQQIVENVLEIIGGATTIEDGIKRPIDRGDVEGALYHMRQAIEASQRLRARQSKSANRALRQFIAAVRKANRRREGGYPRIWPLLNFTWVRSHF